MTRTVDPKVVVELEQRALTGVRCIDSVEQAVAQSIERHGDVRIAVIPEGPYIVPVVGPGARE